MKTTTEATIGQYRDYFNTGLWSVVNGRTIAPDDLTVPQLKDFLLARGGGVYLREGGEIVWSRVEVSK